MTRNQLWILLLALLLLGGIVLFFSAKPVAFSKPGVANSGQPTPQDDRGFVAYCGRDSCVTLPTLIERQGMKWQLGMYTMDGRVQLGYKSTANGSLLSVRQAFS